MLNEINGLSRAMKAQEDCPDGAGSGKEGPHTNPGS